MKNDLEAVKRFVGKIDEYVTVEESDEFAYFYTESRIEICWPEDENPENAQHKADFKAHIKAMYNIDLDTDIKYFVFSLLHELGHHMTMDILSEEQLEDELITRRLIDLTGADDLYFKLPSEIEANEWASYHWYKSRTHELMDKLNEKSINPCDYCSAVAEYPMGEDGATSTACAHCRYWKLLQKLED